MISFIYKHKRKGSVAYKFFKSISNRAIRSLLLAHERKQGTLREERYFRSLEIYRKYPSRLVFAKLGRDFVGVCIPDERTRVSFMGLQEGHWRNVTP